MFLLTISILFYDTKQTLRGKNKTGTSHGAEAGLPLSSAGGRPTSTRGDICRLGCLTLRWVRPEHHMALELACPCPGRESGPYPRVGTPSTWVVCPCAGLDPSATWCWGWLFFPRHKPGPCPHVRTPST